MKKLIKEIYRSTKAFSQKPCLKIPIEKSTTTQASRPISSKECWSIVAKAQGKKS